MRQVAVQKPITTGRMKAELRRVEREAAHGGTGATIIKMVASPVQRLVEGIKQGKQTISIGAVELQAATDIERAFMALSGGLLLKPQTLERVDASRRPDWSPATTESVERYRAWADHWSMMAKRGAPCLEIAIALVIDQRSFSAVEADVGIRKGRAPLILATMLRDYAARAGWCDLALSTRWKDAAEALFRTEHPSLRLAKLAANHW